MGSSGFIMNPLDKLVVVAVVVLVGGMCLSTRGSDVIGFDQNYKVTWGSDHLINDGSSVQIYMDLSSGGGFESKSSYGSGFFQMNIKVPGHDSAGVVTAFYLTSGDSNDHDELDFEFLGNREGKPYTLQTNVFANGQGGREHRIRLWFDPAADYHTYKILWNRYHIVFFVDNIPIRYFNNNEVYGVNYPSKAMKVEASLWDGDSWATDGGQTKTNWSHAPFRANYEGFNIYGCPVSGNDIQPCNTDNYWWNHERYRTLNPTETKGYEIVKHHYVTYDYCNDKTRYPVFAPPECAHQ